MWRLLVGGTKRANELPRRITRDAREFVVIQFALTIGNDVIAHALQTQKYLTSLRISSAGAATDRGAECRLQYKNILDKARSNGVHIAGHRGTRERQRSTAQEPAGHMPGRQQLWLG